MATARRPIEPDDAPHPLSVYGRTKLAGEQAVLAALGPRAVVLRTAWVYAPAGKNFLLTMLRLMRERGAVRVVADQKGSPTAAFSIARALWRLAQLPRVHGILHWTDAGVASWYEFACAIAEDALAAGLLSQPVEVAAIATADYPTAAHRPANSVLDTAASVAQLGLTPIPGVTICAPLWRNCRAVEATAGAGRASSLYWSILVSGNTQSTDRHGATTRYWRRRIHRRQISSTTGWPNILVIGWWYSMR